MNHFNISFALLITSSVICLVWNYAIHIKKLSKYPLLKPINVFTVSTFVAIMILFVPKAYESTENVLITVISAFLDTVDSFSFGNTVEFAIERIVNGFKWFKETSDDTIENSFEVLYTAFMILLAPALTTRAVLSIFTDYFTGLRSRFNMKDDLHIFSQLNEKSLSIAMDISRKGGNNKIVFTSVGKDAGFLADRARKINAMMTKKSIRSFKLNGHLTNKKLFLYFIETEEKNNVKDAIDKYKKINGFKRDTVLYVFSTQESMERVVDVCNDEKGAGHVRLEFFNEAQRTAYNLVFDHPIFNTENKRDVTNIMILGAGQYGLEIAKAISWCSQSLSKKYSIKIFDKQNKNENYIFPFKNIDSKLSEIGTELDVEFYHCDIFSQEFNKLRVKKADYIVVALGDDDELNFSAALLMQELYAREKHASEDDSFNEPKIITHIRDNVLKEIALALKDSSIIPYGSLGEIFTSANLSEWEIDKMASFIHAGYYCNSKKGNKDKSSLGLFEDGLKDYEHQNEVNKRSSRATAIHIKYKLFDLGIDFENGPQKLYEGENKIKKEEKGLLVTEHNRWNVFQLLDGWDRCDGKSLEKGGHKDKKAKLHAYLNKFDELKDIATGIYGKPVNPIDADRMVLTVMINAFAYGVYGEYDKKRTTSMVESIIGTGDAECVKPEVVMK